MMTFEEDDPTIFVGECGEEVELYDVDGLVVQTYCEQCHRVHKFFLI